MTVQDSFERDMASVSGDLFKYIKKRCSNRDDAEDILSQVKYRAFRAYGTLHTKENFRVWAFAIAKSLVMDYFRKANRGRELNIDDFEGIELPFEDEGFSSVIGEGELYDDILKAMSKLSNDQRRAFTMRVFDGKSHKEIGEAVGSPAGTVKTRIHRAGQKLSQLVSHQAPKG